MNSSLNSIDNLNINHLFKPSVKSVFLDGVSFKNSGSLKILYLNSRSLCNKTFEIEQILKSVKSPIHIIAVTETWLNCNNTQYVNITNFTPIHACRPLEREEV